MVVTTILATLATTTLVTLNPVELLAQMRDSQRITTIGMLRDAVSLLVADRPVTTSLAVTNLVHISLPSIHQNCADIAGLPALPTGQTYRCVTAERLTNIDGTGWIPLDFRGITDGSPFATLPVDPINTSTSFYSFIIAPGQRATIAARIESMRQRTIHPPGADGISVFATHFTAAVDRPPLGIGQVAVPLGSTGAPSYTFVGDLNTGIFSPLADNIGFSTAGATRMIIDSLGNVGIGTPAPTTRLDIEGQIRIRGGAPAIGRVLTTDAHGLATWADPTGAPPGGGGVLPGGTLAGQTLRWTGTAWVADSNLFNTGTNVGIGTTAPGAQLEVSASAADTTIRIRPASGANNRVSNYDFWGTFHNFPADTGVRRVANIQAGFATGTWGTEYMAFGLGSNDAAVLPTERMRITGGGNVGIGTTAPGARLEVAGNIIAAPPTASNHVATRGWVEAAIAASNLLPGDLCPGQIEGADRAVASIAFAITTCRNLGSSWRLPSFGELACFVGSPNVSLDRLWTRTPANNTNSYWTLSLTAGSSDPGLPSAWHPFRCVR